MSEFVPAARQRVKIRNRPEIFLVLAVNREEQCAHLVDVEGSGYVDIVPFHLIEPLEQPPPIELNRLV